MTICIALLTFIWKVNFIIVKNKWTPKNKLLFSFTFVSYFVRIVASHSAPTRTFHINNERPDEASCVHTIPPWKQTNDHVLHTHTSRESTRSYQNIYRIRHLNSKLEKETCPAFFLSWLSYNSVYIVWKHIVILGTV